MGQYRVIKMELKRIKIESLIDKYPIGELIRFQRIKQGFMNYSYVLLTNKGKYILRIGKNTKEKKDILFEIGLVNGLDGLPVPKYVKDKSGNFVNRYQGYYYAIYGYLGGRIPKKITKELFVQTAVFLAKFHNQTRNFNNNQERFAWYTFTDQRVDEFENYLLNNLNEYNNEIKYLKDELLRTRLPDNLPEGPIHCDVKRHNIISKGNKLTGVVDFDNCQIGPYILDLAIAITWFCTSQNGLNYKKTYQFLKYYGGYRKLNRLEKKYLFQSIKYAYVSHEFVDFYVYAKKIISKRYFDFGRKLFLTAVKRMDRKKFYCHVESPFAFIHNLIYS